MQIEYNKISILPNLNNLNKLREFNCSNNKICYFPDNTNLLNLEILNLSSNPIESIRNIKLNDNIKIDIANTNID